jgi:hypothetical protein
MLTVLFFRQILTKIGMSQISMVKSYFKISWEFFQRVADPLSRLAPHKRKADQRASNNISCLSEKEVVIFNIYDKVTEVFCDPWKHSNQWRDILKADIFV